MNFVGKLSSFAEEWVTNVSGLLRQSEELQKFYFTVLAVGLGTRPDEEAVTVNSRLTKKQLEDAVAMLADFGNFFTGQDVAAKDYTAVSVSLLHGEAPAAQIISQPLEDFGFAVTECSQKILDVANLSQQILSGYFSTEFNLAVDALSPETIVFGTDTPAGYFREGIEMITHFNEFVRGRPVLKKNFTPVIARWTRVLS